MLFWDTRGIASADRIIEILDTESEIKVIEPIIYLKEFAQKFRLSKLVLNIPKEEKFYMRLALTFPKAKRLRLWVHQVEVSPL